MPLSGSAPPLDPDALADASTPSRDAHLDRAHLALSCPSPLTRAGHGVSKRCPSAATTRSGQTGAEREQALVVVGASGPCHGSRRGVRRRSRRRPGAVAVGAACVLGHVDRGGDPVYGIGERQMQGWPSMSAPRWGPRGCGRRPSRLPNRPPKRSPRLPMSSMRKRPACRACRPPKPPGIGPCLRTSRRTPCASSASPRTS